MVSALSSRCEVARALGRFRCGSGKIRPHCVGPGLLPLFRSKVSPSARSALDVCHWHTAPFAVRLFALLCCHATRRPGRSVAFAAARVKSGPTAWALGFCPRSAPRSRLRLGRRWTCATGTQCPSLSASSRFFVATLIKRLRGPGYHGPPKIFCEKRPAGLPGRPL